MYIGSPQFTCGHSVNGHIIVNRHVVHTLAVSRHIVHACWTSYVWKLDILCTKFRHSYVLRIQVGNVHYGTHYTPYILYHERREIILKNEQIKDLYDYVSGHTDM